MVRQATRVAFRFLSDSNAKVIVMEHRDRLVHLGVDHLVAALGGRVAVGVDTTFDGQVGVCDRGAHADVCCCMASSYAGTGEARVGGGQTGSG